MPSIGHGFNFMENYSLTFIMQRDKIQKNFVDSFDENCLLNKTSEGKIYGIRTF